MSLPQQKISIFEDKKKEAASVTTKNTTTTLFNVDSLILIDKLYKEYM